MSLQVRPAVPDDAAAIAVVRVRSWQAAYAGLVPSERAGYSPHDVPPGTGEVMALYAHPDHWSTGTGRGLMDATLAHLAAAGMAPVLLWVFHDNARARRFYERAGFAPDGAEQLYDAGGVMVPEMRYRDEMTDSSRS